MFSGNKKQNQQEESLWETIEQKLKLWLHSLIHEVLQSQVGSPLIYNLLILIETLQLNYYAIHPLLNKYIWNTNFLSYYQQLIQYFQFNYLLKGSQATTFLAILYICFSINIIVIILMIIATNKIVTNQKKNSTFLSYGIKILATYGLLVTTIIPLPFFNSFLATLICSVDSPYTQNMNCYSGLYFLHLTIAIIGMLIFIFLCLVFTFMFIDMNPSSVIPFASPQTLMPLIKLGMKVLLPFYVTIDYGGKFIQQFIVVLNVLFLFMLFMRYKTAPYYNKKIQSFVIFCESLIFWVAFCALVTTFLDQGTIDNIGLLYVLICFPMFWNVYRNIVHHRKSYFIQLSIKDFKKDDDVEVYVNVLIDLIESREHAESRIKLEGILKYHSKTCPKDTCYCRQLLHDETKDEESQLLSKKWYMFVRSILEDSLEKFVKSSRLHLLHAFIQHEKLKNKFKALFELMIAREHKPNIQEEFSIFRFANLIEDEIKDSDEKTGDTRNVDVNKIVLFQKRFIEFQEIIDKSVQLHLDFWKELLEENPEIQKIENMGSKITSTVEQVKDQFQRLRDIYSNHIKCLEIYGYFLKDIVNDDIEGEKILDNVKYAKNSQSVNKQFVDQDRLKYGENSNTAILTVSGNYGQIGTVTNLNNELTRILGWSKADVIEQNISRIMPKVYADLHDKFMEHYLETSEGKVIGIERTVMCLNKDSFLVPCTLMIKVLPNLSEGIQIVGFLKDIEAANSILKTSNNEQDEKVHYMIYRTDNDSYVMQGITQSCYNSLGIPSSLMYGNSTNNIEFTVDTICPDLLNPEFYEDLKSPAGLIVTIDTTTVQQNFLLDEEDSEDEEYQDATSGIGQTVGLMDEGQETKAKKTKFKRTRVRMNLIEEQTFEDRKVNVVKFVEVDETDEGRSKINQEGYQGSAIEQQQMKEIEKTQMMKQQWTQQQQIQQQHNDRDEEFNASDRDSNISSSSVNEEVRQLKDFKSLISEKTVPKSISILKKTVISLIIVILVLSGVELSFKLSQGNEISTGFNSIFTSYQRTDIMADVNFYSRRVYNLANQIRLPVSPTTQNQAFVNDQSTLSTNVNLLQTNQFQNMKNVINLDSSTYNKLTTALYDVKFQQQQLNDIKTYQNLLTDAMIQYITSSSSLANSTLSSFLPSASSQGYVDSTIKNFFYVIQNGLFVLRKGTEFESQEIFTYYYNENDNFENSFKIIMILGIVFLLLSLVILIPYVFKVHKTNTRVLSLFGMIPIAEIKELVSRCEAYSAQFIDEKKMLQGEQNYQEEEVDQSKQNDSPKGNQNDLEIDGEANENDEVKDSKDIDYEDNKQKNNSDIRSNPQNQLQVPLAGGSDLRNSKINNNLKTNPQTAQNSNLKGAAANKNDANKKGKSQEEEDADNQRSQKLMNSKDNNRKKVIFQFLIFSLLFITYFVVSFVLELTFLQNMRQVLHHLSQVSQRNSIIKYALVYMVEQITTDQIQLQDGEDNLTVFINRSYTIENEINTSSLQSYPSEFSSYFSTFQTANYNNFCTIFPQTPTLTTTDCANVNSKMLQRGLKVSITSYIEGIRTFITNYENAADKSLSFKQKEFALNDYVVLEQMQFYMAPMIEFLNQQLLSAIQTYINNQNSIEEIKFGVFVAFVIIVFLGVWLPYLQQLSHKIWRTKGMLNMIPMDIITKDQNLKQAFQSGDILQAVK
ncbi:PAS domain S-box protein (macronuclear) [Tetrahymena thermophila SB210]|uniref:PAS domain S-box protein n=1 Tax=Tetrahymena thermophila (strain SB210) TaxID=312017 RepID=Q23PR4_TETTS|nr:PAS domain S-box protein [Tetrahymena thermophila SB210]EAR98621.2 PAS domain S-box protein [Tetrahymena thermophila SB210]|eukprot:XP_001018866.2 PAS domain S-box protein [Tetrahymena thermophila SB210]